MNEYNTQPYHEGTLDRHIAEMKKRESHMWIAILSRDDLTRERNRDRLTAYKRKRLEFVGRALNVDPSLLEAYDIRYETSYDPRPRSIHIAPCPVCGGGDWSCGH